MSTLPEIQRDSAAGFFQTLSMTSKLKVFALVSIALVAQLCPVKAQPTNPDPTVSLISTFKEGEQDGLRFAFSYDGYHWSNVPGLFLRAQVGKDRIMRDPSIVRGPDGTWHLVWTSAWRGNNGFGYAHSKDLVHWSEQKFIPVMAHEPTVCNVWAPELLYVDKEKQFIICWASTIPGRFPDHLEPSTNNHRMYFTTTRDFQTFAPTKLFLDPGFSVIDCQILKTSPRSSGRESAPTSTEESDGANSRSLPRENERSYVLLLKDNTRPERNIRVAFGETPLGPWRDFSAKLTPNFTEGPCGLKIGEDWLVYYESYQAGHYSALKTRDFKSFTDITGQMTFPAGLKHGTAFKASRADLERLLSAGASRAEPATGN